MRAPKRERPAGQGGAQVSGKIDGAEYPEDIGNPSDTQEPTKPPAISDLIREWMGRRHA
jgi:hypothetical protein